MKKILITGAGSYIGTFFENYIKENYEKEYQVDTVDMIDGSWREKSFKGYDTVFHVAGIAHSDIGHADEKTKSLYYMVNTDLTVETAKKAKEDGVRQFIFMSSAIVYGESAPIGRQKLITGDTKPEPSNFYGDSKLQAEIGIGKLGDENFKVAVLRPPMIYGRGSKGNYPTLANLARKLPVFPDINNQRSMLYVGNLCEFVKVIIENETEGIFFPQNSEYVSTSQMVKEIAKVNGKNIHLTKLLNPFVWLISKLPGKIGGMANKAFGNLAYDMGMSEYEGMKYRIADFAQTIKMTEVR